VLNLGYERGGSLSLALSFGAEERLDKPGDCALGYSKMSLSSSSSWGV
jgi:hypothetical protein